MHGIDVIIQRNKAAQAAHDALKAMAPAAPRYVSYEYAPVRVIGHDRNWVEMTERCTPDEAEFWTVYGRNPDGTAAAICDCTDEDNAESAMALLNALRPVMAREYTLRDELTGTIALYRGATQPTALERQVLAYAELLLGVVDLLGTAGPVFPLERR